MHREKYFGANSHCRVFPAISYEPEYPQLRDFDSGKLPLHLKIMPNILSFVDRASLYNLVNKANLVHNFS